MKYPAPDGTILESNTTNPVTYTCSKPENLSDGTYVSYETTSDSNNNLKQIKIIRVVNSDTLQITITEQTQQEIDQYFQNINN